MGKSTPSPSTLELLNLFEGQLNVLVHVELVVEHKLDLTLLVQNVSLAPTEDEEVLGDANLGKESRGEGDQHSSTRHC